MNKIMYAMKILGLGLLGFGVIVGYVALIAWSRWFLAPLVLIIIDTFNTVLRDE